MDPPTWTDILTAISTAIAFEVLRRTPKEKGKHQKRKRYRRGKRHK